MPNRPWIRSALSSSALVLLAGALSPVNGQTLVKAAPNSEEVKASHGRTWVAFPDPLFIIRMDKDGKVTGSAAPIGVAHEEQGEAYCAAVRAVGALSTKGATMKTFTPSPRCSFSASDATLILPLDSVAKLGAKVCNEPVPATITPTGCMPDPFHPGQMKCFGIPIIGAPGNAWRRAEGWSGRVPLYSMVRVNLVYDRYAPDEAKTVGDPGVQLTCDKVPCGMSWSGTPDQLGTRPLPDAYTGKPYRAQLFSGAKPPLTFTNNAFLPEGMSIGQDGYLTGTPRRTRVNQFMVMVTESFACPWNAATMKTNGGNSQWSAVFSLTVRDGEPPVIAAFTTSPDTLPAGGGDVVVTLQVSDNDIVTKVLSSRIGPNANHSAAMTRSAGSDGNGTWKITWPVPANTMASPVAYTIKAWAVDRMNNVVNATPKTVVVQAAGQAPGPIRRPIRP